MLTYEDCLAFCDLTHQEIKAIAEHEHIPEILAVELGNYLVHSPDGVPRLKRMILDDIDTAERQGHHDHAQLLRGVLCHFIRTHPKHAEKTHA